MTVDIQTERGFDRLVNFSDATVAIAITLLILPLVDLAGEIGRDTSPLDVVSQHWPSFASFAVTFAVIARFWLQHHRLFEHIARYNRPLIVANFVWLAAIVFLPFAANALSAASRRHDASLFAIFLGTLVVASFASTAMELILRRHPDLLRPDVPPVDLIGSLVSAGLLVVALVLAYAVPAVGLLWILLLLLAPPAERLIRRFLPAERATVDR
jgi:uncharacterized membrane protein